MRLPLPPDPGTFRTMARDHYFVNAVIVLFALVRLIGLAWSH